MIDHTRYTITIGRRRFTIDGARNLAAALESVADMLRPENTEVEFFEESATLYCNGARYRWPMTIEVSSTVTTRRGLFERTRQFLGF